ncbi:MAG: PEP-CTERM system TPR-repeat protein PrsT, partial [Rhodospirillaceae bacterium]|nr:PEP-CTERM system TPR-repeat protein PrsT [Rhodospirillaceae bacterium]
MFKYFSALDGRPKKLGIAVAAVLIASLMISACDEAENSDDFLTRAQEYRDKGDLQASIIEAKNALRINRDNQDARFILGSNYLDLGDWLSAETTLETAIGQGGTLEYAIIPLLARAKLSVGKLHDVLKIAGVRSDMSDDLRARIMVVRGRAHSGLKNHTEANKSFNDALAADPKAFGAFLGLAGLSIASDDRAKGKELLDKAIAIAPENIDVLEFQARFHFLKKDFAETEKFYRALIAQRPTRVAFHAGLINALISSKNYKGAISNLKPLLARSPKNIQLNYLRALAAFRSGDFITAYNTSSTVLGVYKRHTQSMLIAGASAFAKKEYEQAAQYLQQYVQANPSHNEAKMLLSEVQLRQNRVSEATKTLESAAKDQPDNVNLLLAIGRASNMAGDLQKSGDYFQKAVKLNPENTRARAALGASQIALGQTDLGIEELKRAVEKDTDLARAEIALILNLAGQKRYDEALEAVERLQERHPERALGYTVEGLLQFSKGDPASAKVAFRRALQLKPDAADAAANLAAVAIVSKKPEEAKEVLLAVLKHRPKHT